MLKTMLGPAKLLEQYIYIYYYNIAIIMNIHVETLKGIWVISPDIRVKNPFFTVFLYVLKIMYKGHVLFLE